MNQAGVRTPGTVTFVANVGEEGLGDLRGMKALFSETMKGQIDRFVSIDGAGSSCHASSAVGSHRYRVTFKGPGGHSFARVRAAESGERARPRGRENRRISGADDPRTTFNVGRIGGGTSVNAIPSEAWMEVDMRSSDSAALAALDAKFQQAVDRAVVEENARWGRPGVVTVVKELVGDRPAGSISEDAPIVQTALAAGPRGRSAERDQRRIDRREHADEPAYSGHHDRRRRPVDERARAERIVRQHRFVEGDAERVLLTIALAR